MSELSIVVDYTSGTASSGDTYSKGGEGMTPASLVKPAKAIVRPLRVLVPLIKQELDAAQNAGREHYRVAGEMLIEAKDQMPYGSFGRWLSSNFHLSERTARVYMQWARQFGTGDAEVFSSLKELKGDTERARNHRKAERAYKQAARELDAELFGQDANTISDDIELHRALAVELIDIGYKVLATRLHPDRGGSKDAMVRLNRVRQELLQVAKSRRYV